MGFFYYSNMLNFIPGVIMSQAHAMLSQIDKDLVIQCDAIAAQGGPLKLNEKELECTQNSNLQISQQTRVSGRLHGNQPESGVSQNLEFNARLARLNSDEDVGGMYATVSPVYLFVARPGHLAFVKLLCLLHALGQCSVNRSFSH